jgi:hypothetical protein
MALAFLLALLAGVLGTNGIPHFVKGVLKEPFPTPFGGSPVVNLIGGWLMFTGAGACAAFARFDIFPLAFIALATGALAMGLFHAKIGAFGRLN